MLVAGITLPNDASVALHERYGFVPDGRRCTARRAQVRCATGTWAVDEKRALRASGAVAATLAAAGSAERDVGIRLFVAEAEDVGEAEPQRPHGDEAGGR